MFKDPDDAVMLLDSLFRDAECLCRVEGDAVGVVAAEEHHLIPVQQEVSGIKTACP